ncbi:TetR/AcrR family transcriptional regulator [Nonomuraea rhizosphaerae]|uniref:TetR/AcrR family transcriptional regulator n=1 Tax=Nonomuraea rhizosphaerae TaxID=2665663 RepID=UPI001C6015FB|nr:TetR/AcrR family transcriptional regulator [Nonomuraea rhizosphaerae]
MSVETRADRILDAAGELIMRLGPRKVTIDDIAQLADIGKGTVYLHWRTKQQLFEALFTREAVIYVEKLIALLRHDPAAVRPHRLIAESFLIVGGRPMLRALLTGDTGVVQGRLTGAAIRGHELLATARFHEVMTRHGLFRDDVAHLTYGLSALQGGFFLLETLGLAPEDLPMEAKAEALAHLVRRAYEPDTPPSRETLAAAAAELVALSEAVIPPYLEDIYGTRRD